MALYRLREMIAGRDIRDGFAFHRVAEKCKPRTWLTDESITTIVLQLRATFGVPVPVKILLLETGTAIFLPTLLNLMRGNLLFGLLV